MVPGSEHAYFLGYFDWFTDGYVYWLMDWFLPRQAVQVHTCWVLYLLLASGITRRLGTALAGAREVAVAKRKGVSLRSSDPWREPWQAAKHQIAKEEKAPAHSARRGRDQAVRGVEQRKEQRLCTGGLRFCRSESHHPPPAPIIPMEPIHNDLLIPSHTEPAPDTCCCLWNVLST